MNKEIDWSRAGMHTIRLHDRLRRTQDPSEQLLRRVEDHIRRKIRRGFYDK